MLKQFDPDKQMDWNPLCLDNLLDVDEEVFLGMIMRRSDAAHLYQGLLKIIQAYELGTNVVLEMSELRAFRVLGKRMEQGQAEALDKFGTDILALPKER